MYVTLYRYFDVKTDEDLQQAFSIHCLMPVLRFLSIWKSFSASFPRNETINKALENLLVDNIILPARGSFLNPKSWGKSESEAKSSLSAESLLSPLGELPNTRFEELSLPKYTDLAIPTISLLYSVAIESLPRVTPKQRSLEDSWLRYLFHQLEQCASRFCTQLKSSLHSKTYISTLNWMLSKAVDHKVRLGDSRFEPLINQIMSISDEDFDAPGTPIHWTFMSLSLKTDPNIFTSVNKNVDGNSDLAPNTHFASLVSRVTNTGWKKSSYNNVNYNAKLSTILLPLAQAFANARDLMTFISHWQEQLTICQQRRHRMRSSAPESYLVKIVWEDEKLLLFVGNLIESSLTTGQINSMFEKVHANLTPSSSITSNDYSGSVGSLIILDCIVSGLSKESILNQLVETARSVYFSVVKIVSSTSIWPIEHTWRWWRILATLNNRWSIPQYSKATEEAEEYAKSKAVESIREALSEEARHVAQDFTKELHAFSFLLSSSYVHVNKPDVSQTKNSTIISVIETILDRKQALSDSIGLKMSESRALLVQWDGQNETVTSVDILFIGCIARILLSPSVLRSDILFYVKKIYQRLTMF